MNDMEAMMDTEMVVGFTGERKRFGDMTKADIKRIEAALSLVDEVVLLAEPSATSSEIADAVAERADAPKEHVVAFIDDNDDLPPAQ